MATPGQIERRYILLAARIAGDFGVTIAVPVVALSSLGKWLDTRYGTWPGLTVLGFAVAAVVTAVILRRKAVAYASEYSAIIAEDRASRASAKASPPKTTID